MVDNEKNEEAQEPKESKKKLLPLLKRRLL